MLASISLFLVSKSDFLVSISLFLVSKSDFLASISLFLVSKSDFLVSISLLLVSKSDFLAADQLSLRSGARSRKFSLYAAAGNSFHRSAITPRRFNAGMVPPASPSQLVPSSRA